MIIFESILTTFKSRVVFRGSSDSSDNWFEPRIEPALANLACPNMLITLCHIYVDSTSVLVSISLTFYARFFTDFLAPENF
jgi:hypothetical protein